MINDKKCSNGCGKEGTIKNTIGLDVVEWWCLDCACEVCLFARSDEWESVCDCNDCLKKTPNAIKCKCGYYYIKLDNTN